MPVHPIRKFIGYYRPYRMLFLADMLCALTVCAIDLAFPQILQYVTEEAFARPPDTFNRLLVGLAIGLPALYAVRFGAQYFITSWGHIMGARMESDMRQDLFLQFQRLSFTYYDRNNTGEMMSKLVGDLFDISELAHHGPENLLICTLKIVGAFVLLAAIHGPMTLILLSVTLVMVVFSVVQNRKMRAVFLDNRKKIADVNARVQDALTGIRVVKSFANEDVEAYKFDETNLRFLDSKTSSYKIMGLFHGGNGFFEGLLYTSVLVSGGYFIMEKQITATELAVYAIYIGIFLNPIEVLLHFTEQYQRGYSGFRRFLEVIEATPEIVDAPKARTLENVEGRIAFDNVHFRYGDGPEILHGVQLTVAPGETVALVGPSGGGKSTLCALLPRFYDVADGRVTIDGHDVREVTQRSLRAAIGIVQQDVHLFSGTIRDNIGYGRPGADDEAIEAAARRAHIHEFIASLPDGYDTHTGERGVRLSGGQKQRIAIARVFLKDPRILILDEATSALDNESERQVQASLEELSRGRATLVIAHRLSTIRRADRIAVMSEGRIEECGGHDELLARGGTYARYYHLQFEGRST